MAPTPWATICDLPNEMLVFIFRFLPVADLARCAATCERWHGIVRDFNRLWKGKTYRSGNSPAECADTRMVLRALPSFQEVTIDSIDGFGVYVSYPKLVLSVKYVRVLDDFPRLRCEYFSARLDIAGDIVSCRSTVDFERLRHLQILQMWTLNSWAPRCYSADRVIRTALALCPRLTRVGVCADSVSADYLDAVEELGRLRTLEVECPGLEKLSFLRHCSDALEDLQLVGCSGLPSHELTELRWLRNLRQLRLAGCRFEAADLAAAVAGLSSLEALQLDCCSSVRDLSILCHCIRLRELSVTTTTVPVPELLATVRPTDRLLRLQDLRLPADVEVRSLRAVGVTLTAADLSTALSRLEELGLPGSCLRYMAALRCCPWLRHLCCEFVQGSGEPEQLNVRVHITIAGSP